MSLEYKQLAQVRATDTNPTFLYSSGVGETVLIELVIVNTTVDDVAVRIFHDNDGTTYDESTAIRWDFIIEAGLFLPIKIKMDNSAGNLAYRTATANALTATVYGIVKT